MPSIHIAQLNVTIDGIDPGTVHAAVKALPAAIATELRQSSSNSSTPVDPLAHAVAQQVAAAVRARVEVV